MNFDERLETAANRLLKGSVLIGAAAWLGKHGFDFITFEFATLGSLSFAWFSVGCLAIVVFAMVFTATGLFAAFLEVLDPTGSVAKVRVLTRGVALVLSVGVFFFIVKIVEENVAPVGP